MCSTERRVKGMKVTDPSNWSLQRQLSVTPNRGEENRKGIMKIIDTPHLSINPRTWWGVLHSGHTWATLSCVYSVQNMLFERGIDIWYPILRWYPFELIVICCNLFIVWFILYYILISLSLSLCLVILNLSVCHSIIALHAAEVYSRSE